MLLTRMLSYKYSSAIITPLTSPYTSHHSRLLHLSIQLPLHHPLLRTPWFVPKHSNAMMKLQAVAAALCLVVLLVASETVLTASAAGCNVYKLAPCIAASKNANVAPSRQCCTNIATLGQGQAGAKCLCSLLSSSLAKSQGVVPRIALAIPQKCRIAVPKGFVCQGIRVPGS